MGKHACKLPPFKVQEVLTLEEAKQQVGWGVSAFKVPSTWNKTQGEGVKIAVLDTGCDLTHPDLKDNLLPGMNFVEPGEPPTDDNKHGTHCIGIICASNNDIGMVGVAPKSKVMPVRVLGKNGGGSLEIVAKGIRWAADNGADIISMSLGSPTPLQQVRKAIQYAAAKNIPVFVAAGNAGNTDEIFYPAAYPETIAIGSINDKFDRSTFSCTGKNLDFMAPGDHIFSTVPKKWYAILSGTSMATPFAVGVAALILSYVRKHNVNISLKSSQDYINIFKKHTIQIQNKDWNDPAFFQGFGIIDPASIINGL